MSDAELGGSYDRAIILAQCKEMMRQWATSWAPSFSERQIASRVCTGKPAAA